ncbi:hypothetical protein AVEN_268962-1 [Araneus ventricosus]|uniref:Uncharacterized protein n=1 Tax=Araneus ventricosus TaxID=182803 RepID=A0A4Y2I399_ARAVE|nr:hypothetical protein AVEN_268962-1 [Araneus ventricosus]
MLQQRCGMLCRGIFAETYIPSRCVRVPRLGVWGTSSRNTSPRAVHQRARGRPSLAFRQTRLRKKKWVNEGPSKGCTASHNGWPSPVALASPFDMSMGTSSHVDSKQPSQY